VKVVKIRHTGLQVSNLNRAIAWYRKLGFKVAQRRVETWGNQELKICKMFINENQWIELVEGEWKPHICLEVEDIKYQIDWDKQTEEHNIKFFEDNWGNRLELVEVKK
jgi:catechol 2,3-dioxygenase-like lactoylglutathione lyase family enzyme